MMTDKLIVVVGLAALVVFIYRVTHWKDTPGDRIWSASIGGRIATGATEKEAVECLSWKLLCERTLEELTPQMAEASERTAEEERALVVAWLGCRHAGDAVWMGDVIRDIENGAHVTWAAKEVAP